MSRLAWALDRVLERPLGLDWEKQQVGSEEDRMTEEKTRKIGFFAAVGLIIGVVVGNVGLGIAIGLVFGAGVGFAMLAKSE
jgi:hypothetical protein